MEAGDFSQGGGYYYGMGIVDARGAGADTYIGNRYAQGTSAHFGIGVMLDEGGNDFYDTRGMVATGISNDHSMSWFRDGGGSDRYAAQMFCGGASANNGLSIFEDVSGKDVWVGSLGVANGQSNDYWGGKSLSLVFLGQGGPAPVLEARDGNVFIFRKGKLGEALATSFSLAELPDLKPML